jgi:membrane protease YdiL (CAAX protease family)
VTSPAARVKAGTGLPLPGAPRVRSYWKASRAPRYSLLFALPLLLLYEGLSAALAGAPGVSSVRNAADVALKTPFLMFAGARGSLAFFAIVVAVSVFLVARDLTRSRDTLRLRYFAAMFGESAILGVLLGVVVGTLTARLLGGLSALSVQGAPGSIESMGFSSRLMLALGAGLYEELLFRVLLVGGLAAGLRWVVGLSLPVAGTIAAIAGALVFSGFHYVGEYGDPWELASFTYRAIAGLVFSGLYLIRGFGITAWTHALYDVYVMVI